MKKPAISRNVRQSLPVFLSVLIILIIEFAGFNRFFTISSISSQEPTVLQFEHGLMFHFSYQNDLLTAEGLDPRLVYADLNREVALIEINCDPLYPHNQSQVFFSTTNDPLSEYNSIRFSLDTENKIFVLPQKILVNDLRFDLANDAGEVLACENIILNPEVDLQANPLRYFAYALFLALIAWLSYSRGPNSWTNWINKWGQWAILVYSGVVAGIYFLFPLVLTYDSGHYLWLSDLLQQSNFSQWDIIRNLVFPLHLHLSRSIFSDSIIGLKIPMVIFYLVFLYVLYKLVISVAEIKTGEAKFWVTTAIFALVALDPTIFGYFHAVLTEYMAATFAAVACLLGFKLYQSKPYSKEFWLLNAALVLISLVGWHIKQPYLGIGLFPHAISYLLILTKKPGIRAWLIGVGIVLIILIAAVGSTMQWELFLANRGNELDTSRQFNTWLMRYLSMQYETPSDTNAQDPVRNIVNKYLTSSNFYSFDRAESRMVKSPSLTRAAQNREIAQNIYRIGRESLVGGSFENVTDPYIEIASPPGVINNIFRSGLVTSNFLFTIAYLSLPLFLIGYLLWFIIKKNPLSVAALILSGSAAGNALIHNISGAAPLDRYFFWGYPLILVSWILVMIAVLRRINQAFESNSTIKKTMASRKAQK